jgi:hypothetical protein
MLLRAEPTKQKTRRPERSGITRAVSPKKIGKERRENVELTLSNVEKERDPERGKRCGSNV